MMQVCLLMMIFILALCPFLLADGVQTLTIDSQLGTSVEDCFDRISIGEQLPLSAIYRNVSELTTRECEQICKQDKQCRAYDYGVGAKGNATCNLSNIEEKEIKEKSLLTRHPDYDVYVRRFQCEQSPPSPLQAQFDEPNNPSHRPVFRPDSDEKRPLSDDPNDLRPHETNRPVKPYYQNNLDERPDFYDPSKPENDIPPSYGDHRPSSTPYKPYRNHTYSYRPDPYDVLHFQGYGRPESMRPYHQYDLYDLYGQKPLYPYRPYDYHYRPHYRPQKPYDEFYDSYGYGNRPSDRPGYNEISRPQDYERPHAEYHHPQRPADTGYNRPKPDDFGYNRPKPDYNRPINTDSGYNRPSDVEYNKPKPDDYGYNKPQPDDFGYNKPKPDSYGYSKPKPGDYGYNKPQPDDFGYNKPKPDSYGYSKPNPGDYGYNKPKPDDFGYNRPKPNDFGYDKPKPDHVGYNKPKPDDFGYNKPIPNDIGYNKPKPDDIGYNKPKPDDIGYIKPKPDYNRPTNPNSGYNSPQIPDDSGYNRPTDVGYSKPKPINSGYKPSKPHDYHQSNDSGYNRPQNPEFEYSKPQNTYGINSRPYPNNHYSSSRPMYRPQKPLYYGENHYGSNDNAVYVELYDRPFYERPSNGIYGYGTHGYRPLNNKPIYEYESTYGSQFDGYKPQYTKPLPSSERPSYGSIETNRPYGSFEHTYDSNRPAYGTQSTYGSSQPTYGNSQPTYGSNKPTYDTNRPTYGSSQSTYGSNKPTYDNKPIYGSSQPTYGSSQPTYTNKPYGNDSDRPDGENSDNNDTGYSRPSQNKPNIKPVYEYEIEKPSNVPSYIVGVNGEVVTSRPVSVSYGSPGYGRDPGIVSYRACFRRVLAGKRALRSHVRRVVSCERLEDCRRECATERRFYCESFNYRLDPSSRGKGLCELMTKPIEAFDIRSDFVEDKDYDFYEVDRNSLEPNCPVTLRGPGQLHSGYLTSKPNRVDQWSERGDWSEKDRRYPYKPHSFEENYVPYQISIPPTNTAENWGQYAGKYGSDNYYKNRNDFHKSIGHWRLNQDGGKHASGKYDYRKEGSWGLNGSWTGLDYGESSYYRPFGGEGREESGGEKDCTSRRRPGMSLSTGSIKKALHASNVVECESACFDEREFKCVSYSFRYSSSFGTDNCYLSARPYRALEMSPDTAADVYAMPVDRGCGVSNEAFVESECFWHVRSGSAVSGSAVRARLAATGLGACEAECIRATDFYCRGFSYRFDSATIGDDAEACLLTSTPPTTLLRGRGLRPSAGHELYARGNYGRGCEPAIYDDLPHEHKETDCYLQYDNAAKLTAGAVRGHAAVRGQTACGHTCSEAPFRCLSFSYNPNVPPGQDNCLLSDIRLFDLQRGVDYEHSANDLLFAFDLFNGNCWRRANGKDDVHTSELPHPIVPPEDIPSSGPSAVGYLPAAPEPYPDSGPSGPVYKPTGPEPKPIPEPGYKPYPAHTGPDIPEYKPNYPPISGPEYLPQKPEDKPGYYVPGFSPPGYSPPNFAPSGSGYNKPGFVPPSGSGKPGYLPDASYPVEEHGPVYRPGKPDREENEPVSLSWRHYTVGGLPCRGGTVCAQNHVAGHWACEPEGGEVGSWDYCCAPTHRCGYSEGFHKPWCYVGPKVDQWRPCSEKYYPYHQHETPHPSSQGHRENRRPWSRPSRPDGDRFPRPYLSEADRKYWDDLYNNGPQAYYDKFGNPLPGYSHVPPERPDIHNYPHSGQSSQWQPSHPQELEPPVPGGLGVPRYWPVAYLHKGPPPNMTYFRYNETKPTTEKYDNSFPITPPKEEPPSDFNKPKTNKLNNNLETKSHRDEKTRNINITNDDVPNLNLTKVTTTTPKVEVKSALEKEPNVKPNNTDVEIIPEVKTDKTDTAKGIDDKLEDFSGSIEVLNIEDVKGDKIPDLKTLEAEERQIEAIGRILASRRGGKLVLEKRSQKDLETKSIAVDRDLVDFNFGNRFPTTERRGVVQKVSKDEIEKERNNNMNDKSLEVSETTFVRPPRILSTTENVRKAFVNGKVFYDAMIREQREANATRKAKSLKPLEERAPTVINNSNYGKKKTIRPRNVNPVRKVRRVYRKRYNPEEVRRRLLEREKSKDNATDV